MTRPVYEDGYSKEIARGGYRVSQLERRPDSPAGGASYEIKVTDDVTVDNVVVGDDQFIWKIPLDLDEGEIIRVEAFLGIAGTGATQIQIRLGDCDSGSDILTTKLNIPSGDCNDDGAAVIATNTLVAEGDHLRIDVDSAASGASGLGVIVTILPKEYAKVIIAGAKGDKGGVTSWNGVYDSGDTYNEGDSVENNGTSYVARVDNPTTEPGVDPGWEDEWQVLAERQLFTAVTFHETNHDRVVDLGIKGRVWIPFDCTVVAYTLLADFTGDLDLDLWVDDYGVYPPDSSDSICGGNGPSLVAENKTQDTILTGWTTFIPEDSTLLLHQTALATLITAYSLTLKLQRV